MNAGPGSVRRLGSCPACGGNRATWIDDELFACSDCKWSAQNIHNQVDYLLALLAEEIAEQTAPAADDESLRGQEHAPDDNT